MAPPTWKKKKSLLTFLINFFHVFNVFLFISGCGLAAVSVWTILYKQNYIILVKTVIYSIIPWVLLTVAVFSMLVAVLGSCAVRHHHRCLLVLYIFSLVLILVVELMTGCLASAYRDKVEFDLSNNLPETFLETYGKSTQYTQAIDDMQQTYKCCGAESFEEWFGVLGKRVPDSCCKTVTPDCGKSHHPSNIPYTGCIHKLSEELEQHLVIVSAVSLGVSIIPVIGVILACWIYIKMKDHSQYNGYTPGNTNPM